MLSSNRSFHCCGVAHEGLRKTNTVSKQFSDIWRKQSDKYGGFPILHPRAPGRSVTHHTATMLLTAWKQGPAIFYVGTWSTTPLPYPGVRTWLALPLTNPHIGTWSVMFQPPPPQPRHIPAWSPEEAAVCSPATAQVTERGTKSSGCNRGLGRKWWRKDVDKGTRRKRFKNRWINIWMNAW